MQMPGLDSDSPSPNLPSTIRCIYWNVRSISGKKNVRHLQKYITKKQVDLLFLSETWQRKGQPLPDLQDYGLISCMSDQTGGRGGVACYYKRDYEPYLSCYKKDPEGHYIWLKIDKELGFEKDLFAAVCYYPPQSSTAYKGRNRQDDNFPYGNLNKDVANFTKNETNVDFFVVGDFNSRIGNAQATEAHRHGLSRESADKKTNKFGMPLLDVCTDNDLIICNGVTQVWPRSGKTTCRSRSVVDYILAPVSRARYLVKDIDILPLEKKSDHNAMNFTLRRPQPQSKPLLHKSESEDHPNCIVPSSDVVEPLRQTETLRTQLEELLKRIEHNEQAANDLRTEFGDVNMNPPSTATGVNTHKEKGALVDEHCSPKIVTLASGDSNSASAENNGFQGLTVQIDRLNVQGLKRSSIQSRTQDFDNFLLQSPERERYVRRMEERRARKESSTSHKELEEPRREKPSSRTNAMFEPPFGPEFDAVAWVEAKTTRLFNKILADGLGSQDRHQKPAGIADHPIFPFHKKSYMTRQYHSLNRFTAPSTKVHGSFTSSPSTSKEWNRKVEETLVQDAIRQSDKRELMTINSRPASVTSPGIVHVARLYVRADTSCRGQSSDGSRMTNAGLRAPKGFRVGGGFRCTCMYPSHSRDLQLDHPMKTDIWTKSMTVVESSTFSNFVQNLKSAYDSGKLWTSITQFKIARKIVKAMR